MSSCISRAIFLSALLSVSAPAFAEIIQIPAVTFAVRSNSSPTLGDDNMGTLTNAAGKYYAAIPFPTDGMKVCKFTLVHRDNDGDFAIIARLLKKPIQIGGMPFEPPVEMARVSTGGPGATATVARKNDVSITQPTIDLKNAFYYVELEFGANTLEALGVQIDVRSACTPQ
jgi:hypothetical protein